MSGLAIGLLVTITLVVLLVGSYSAFYSHSENRNFETLRKKSELDCDALPLHCMVEGGRLGEISSYIQRGGPLELKDNWGQSALLWALRRDKGTLVPILLHAGADPNTKDDSGMSILYQAIVWEKYDIADLLLLHGADIDLLSGNQYPETPLHYCVMKNRLDCVQYALGKGANKDVHDSFGYTVLDRVMTHNHISKEIGEALEN